MQNAQRQFGSLSSLWRIFAVISALAVLMAGPTSALTVEEITSEKGIKAWLVEEHSVPLIAIRFAFVGGASQDPVGKEGLADMMSDLLTEGGGDLPAAAFKERFLRLGARLSAATGRDAIYGSLETLTARFGPSTELLRLMVTNPRFDAEAVDQIRAQHLTDLAQGAKVPTKIVVDRWYAEAYPDHVYARPVKGTPDSIARVTRDDLKVQRSALFAKDALKVVIVGDIDKSAAAAAIDNIFGSLAENGQITTVARIEPRALQAPVVVTMDQPLATATFGLPSLPTDHPDFPALQVLNHIIGSGDFDSLLMEELRVKRGLAYSIKTSLLNDSIASLLLGGFATKNENMGAALSVVGDVLARTAHDGPTQFQFANAKRFLTGSFLLDFDTNAKVANSLLGIWLRGEKADYLQTRNQRISGVTLGDVKRVAKEVFRADRLIVTIVGMPKLAQ
jgi:zinc protease